MAKKKAANARAERKDVQMMVLVAGSEKSAFQQAASLSGMGLSGWVRLRLRDAAARELEAAGKPVPFKV